MREPNEPIHLQDMQIEFELVGQTVRIQAQASLRLLPKPHLVFKTSGFPEPMLVGPVSLDGPTKIRLETGIELELVDGGWLPFMIDPVLRPRFSTCTVLETGGLPESVQFSILNFPGHLLGRDRTLRAGSWVIEINEASNFSTTSRTLRAEGGFAITHQGVLAKRNGGSFRVKSAKLVLEALERFLSFARGVSCSVTNITGLDSGENEVWKQWGAGHVASWQGSISWFDSSNGKMLSKAFPGFWKLFSQSRVGLQLRRILAWYTLSNESTALESRIALTQAALESIAHLVLSFSPNHQALLNKRGYAAKKLRLALSKVGIASKIPKHCQELANASSRRGWKDGPEAVVEVRNDLIHPVKEFRPRSLDPYFDAWQLSQWYVELMLLNLFKYQGSYRNRLDLPMKLGKVEIVPWAQTGASSL